MPSEESLVIARTHCSQCLLKATTEYLCVRCESLASAIDVAKREAAEALIPVGSCEDCAEGDSPERKACTDGSTAWFHEGWGWPCPNSTQHELLHQLQESEA